MSCRNGYRKLFLFDALAQRQGRPPNPMVDRNFAMAAPPSIAGNAMCSAVKWPWSAVAFDVLIIELSHAFGGWSAVHCRFVDFTIVVVRLAQLNGAGNSSSPRIVANTMNDAALGYVLAGVKGARSTGGRIFDVNCLGVGRNCAQSHFTGTSLMRWSLSSAISPIRVKPIFLRGSHRPPAVALVTTKPARL